MATTKGKDVSSLGKEKRVISPSKSRATKSSGLKQPSPITVDRKAPSSPKKQVPNYLRPTVSSRPGSPKNAKKNGPEDTATTQNKSFIRRRSFDKATPPPSTIQTSVLSPGRRERTITVRSASFSSKTAATSSPRTVVERSSKTLMPGKQQPLNAKNEKKKITQSVNNNASAAAASTEDPKNILDTTETLSLDQTQQEDGKYVVREVKEVVEVEEQIENENEKPSEVREYENDDEHVNNVVVSEVIINNGGDEKVKVKPCDDIPVVSEEIEQINPIAQIEEAKDVSAQEEKTEINQNGGEENGRKDDNHHPAEESFISETKVHEVKEDIGGEERDAGATDKDSPARYENKNESNTVEEKEEGVNGGNEEKEGQDVKGCSSVEERKPEVVANNITASRQVGQGMKKDSQANNDVIEETKNKLLEKRKNKVRALVGAFETVIDKEAASIPK